MRRTTRGSVINAMSRRRPPQRGQCNTSISKTRFINSAQLGPRGEGSGTVSGGGGSEAGGRTARAEVEGSGWEIVAMGA
jgi:hypothetical protein